MPAAALVGQLELGLGLFVQPQSWLLQPSVELGFDRLLAIEVDQLNHHDQPAEPIDVVELVDAEQPAELDIVKLIDLAQRLRLDRQLILVGKLTARRG